MKAQSIPEIPLLGIIGTIAIIGGILIPPAIIKTTLDKELVLTYEYEKTQLDLLALLSSTQGNIPVYEIIANNINTPDNLEFLKEGLNTIIESKCYSLQVGDTESDFKTLLENGVCSKKYKFTTTITLPYNPELKSQIKLLRIGVG